MTQDILRRIGVMTERSDASARDELIGMTGWFEIADSSAGGTERAPLDAPLALSPEGRRVVDGSLEGDAVVELANAIERARRLVEYRLRVRKPGDLVIVSEGDSWFQYPFRLDDIIDVLKEPYLIRSLGGGGHRIADMALSGEFEKAIRDEQPHVFLLSGGGNDLLGKLGPERRLFTLLHDYQDGATPESLINRDAFDRATGEIKAAYLDICARALAVEESLRVFLHGYDYALPRDGGVWLREPMEARGIPAALQAPIVRLLIDGFYQLLGEVAAQLGPNIEVLNLRGRVGSHKGSWLDELHPRDAGFRRVAKVYQERLEDIRMRLPQTTPSASAEAKVAVPDRNPDLPVADDPVFGDFLNLRPLTPSCHDAVCRVPGGPAHASPADAKRWLHASRRDVCSDLNAWRDELNEEDLRAYQAMLRLRDSFDEPDSPERLNLRESLSRSLPGLRPNHLGSSLERILGASNVRGIAYLARGLEAARAVGRVYATDPYGQPSIGSGFLVGENLLLTNNHVMFPGTEAQSRVDFDLEVDSDGVSEVVRSFATDPDLFLTDEGLDFSLVGLAPLSTDGTTTLASYGRLRLLPDSGKALKREPVSIIQHPGGGHKSIALRDSYVLGRDGDHLYYTTDTEAGSSGSPVLSDDWYVVALHHRTVPNPNEPCRWVANRGIRISRIIERLHELADGGDTRASVARKLMARLFAPDPIRRAPVEDPESEKHGAPELGGVATIAGPPQAYPQDGSAEKLVGADNRERLLQADRRHAAILSTLSGAKLGTGVVVGRRLVLTVSHALTPQMLKLRRFDDAARFIDVAAGIGASGFTEQRTSATGRAGQFTGLKLLAQGGFSTRLVPTLISPSDLVGEEVEVIGYPKILWRLPATNICAVHKGKVGAVQNGLIFYTDLDVTEGQSGGAVVLAGTNKLVGLHLSGPVPPLPPSILDVNIGIHIGATQMQEISQWNI